MTGHQWLDVLIGIAVALLLTWLVLFAALLMKRRKGKILHLEAAYRQFSSTGALPERDPRLRLRLLVLAVLIILNAALLGLLLSQAPPDRAVESTSAQTPTPSEQSSSAGPSPASSSEEATIQLKDPPASARPFQAVRIRGTFRGGADTFLQVQRWEGGKWQAFPVPTKTDQSGHFSTFVEFGQPGRYQLRVVDPDSGVTSKPFVLVIKA